MHADRRNRVPTNSAVLEWTCTAPNCTALQCLSQWYFSFLYVTTTGRRGCKDFAHSIECPFTFWGNLRQDCFFLRQDLLCLQQDLVEIRQDPSWGSTGKIQQFPPYTTERNSRKINSPGLSRSGSEWPAGIDWPSDVVTLCNKRLALRAHGRGSMNNSVVNFLLDWRKMCWFCLLLYCAMPAKLRLSMEKGTRERGVSQVFRFWSGSVGNYYVPFFSLKCSSYNCLTMTYFSMELVRQLINLICWYLRWGKRSRQFKIV